MADVRIMAQAFAEFYKTGKTNILDRYSEICLRRVWKAQRSPAVDDFQKACTASTRTTHSMNAAKIAELDYVTSSRAAMTTLAENYVGLPWD